jgi:orotidine-5'-phosphate decarboxylase
LTQLILPVDVSNRNDITDILSRTQGLIDYYKFGSIPFTALGPETIALGHGAGARVFIDLKFHDIPNTVAGAGQACVEQGADMFNVHISGGREMLRKTMARVHETASRLGQPVPIVLGVTVLTSMDDRSWADTFGKPLAVADQVRYFARLARECGLHGVVASPQEIEGIKQECGSDFLVLTPGIRMPDTPVAGDDQARTATPAEAARRGADFIVVGRPILQAKDPAAVCARIREDIRKAGT